MSRENVEIARRFHDHFDETGEPLWDVIDSEIEVYDHDIPDAGTYHGLAGYTKWLTNWGETFGSYAMKLERLVDAGDRVVSLFLMRAIGRGSGVSVERRDAMVSTIRDGKVTRIDYYNDQAEALEAVGLSEQDSHAGS
jgi:ketosteroid isomerase-like protein